MKVLVFTVTVLLGCGPGQAALLDSARADSLAREHQDSLNRAQPGYIVDSILPMEEHLRRFRVGLVEVPTQLQGAASSRDMLVRRFVRGLEAADTAALVRLTISRAEFAYLVFPESAFSDGPLAQAPDLVWLRHTAASATGLGRLLTRLGGLSLGFDSWQCGGKPSIEGRNRIWAGCQVRFTRDGQTHDLRLFAGIIERGGRFKILSYANGF